MTAGPAPVERPAITSVMLCWNRLPLSRICLESYLDTITVPFELYVTDNASTDGTADWLTEVARLPEVTDVIRMSRNEPAAALNRGLFRGSGGLLHLMENDYQYLPGWDRYVLDRFERLPELGQLALFEGDPRFHDGSWNGLVWLAAANVCTTSVLRGELFTDLGIRVHGHYLGNRYPDDHDLSMQVRRAGFRVAWPDRDLARNMGFEESEYRRDPGYYVRDYALKLFSWARLRGNLRQWLRLDFHDVSTLVRRLTRALVLKLKQMSGRR